MDTLEFKPNEEYIKLVEISEKRKLELNLTGLNYKQLTRKKLFVQYNYELHHIEPRYRFKNKCTSLLNASDNIAVLTIREHLLAHYYLTLFEVGSFSWSAKMAFIQLFSLSKNKPSLTLDEIEILIPAIEKARLEYFGSDAHKSASKKAGVIAGEKRRKRFEDDPEFREYLLQRLKRTPEQREIQAYDLMEKNKTLPPWKVNQSSGKSGLKYKPQFWDKFDSVYVGVIKYKLSYKAIARCMEIPHQRISNMVKILRSKTNLPEEFEDYEFYSDFVKDYTVEYFKFEDRFKYYSSNKIPWFANKLMEKSWFYFDVIFKNSIIILEAGRKLRMLDIHPFVKTSVSSPKIHKEVIKLYNQGIREMKDVPWFSEWETMKSFYQTPPFILDIYKGGICIT